MEHTKVFTILSWLLRGIAAVILPQTLFFKFRGAKEIRKLNAIAKIRPGYLARIAGEHA